MIDDDDVRYFLEVSDVTGSAQIERNAGQRRSPTFSKGNGVPPLLGDMEGEL